MPFTIERNDLVTMQVDALVNTANPQPIIGSGVDYAVHSAAGPRLLEARRKIGRIRVGQAMLTPGFDLPAKYVIHAVGPGWEGGRANEEALLRNCYDAALNLAWQNGCRSVAFPLMGAGNYGFPRETALKIATQAARDFLRHRDMDIRLVVFQKEAFRLADRLYDDVASFIDDHYVDRKHRDEYRDFSSGVPVARRNIMSAPMVMEECCAAPFSMEEDLSAMMETMDAGFSETLLALIVSRGKTDAEVYKKANIDRKLFSKIRNNPGYKPSKATALAFAIALELTWQETLDFIGRAGYTLSHSSKFDIIIEYFIRHTNYDIFAINEALFAFDQMLLGA